MNPLKYEEVLLQTPDYDLQKVFPGYTQKQLRDMKKKVRDKYGITRFQKGESHMGKKTAPVKELVEADKNRGKKKDEVKGLREKYEFVLKENERLLAEQTAILRITQPPEIVDIGKRKSTGTTEATAIIVASDWHYEEEVKGSQVSGLNSFNLEIADRRSTLFFQNALKLVEMCKHSVNIKNIVIALLGDKIRYCLLNPLIRWNPRPGNTELTQH